MAELPARPRAEAAADQPVRGGSVEGEHLTEGLLRPAGCRGGSDATVALQWGYAAGATAQLRCATTAATPGRATIAGTAGSISADPWFLNPERLVVTTSEGEFQIEGERTAYGPQIEGVERCLHDGLLESPLAPHADAIAILELIDQARTDLDVGYPDETWLVGAPCSQALKASMFYGRRSTGVPGSRRRARLRPCYHRPPGLRVAQLPQPRSGRLVLVHPGGGSSAGSGQGRWPRPRPGPWGRLRQGS